MLTLLNFFGSRREEIGLYAGGYDVSKAQSLKYSAVFPVEFSKQLRRIPLAQILLRFE